MSQKKCPTCGLDLKILPSSGRYVCSCGWTSKKNNNIDSLQQEKETRKAKVINTERIGKKNLTEHEKSLEKHEYKQVLKDAKKHLDINESICEIILFQPISWGRMFTQKIEGVTLATNERIIVFTPATIDGYDLESLDYSKISSINLKEGLVYDELELSTSGDKIEIQNILKGNTLNFVKYVREKLSKSFSPSNNKITDSRDNYSQEKLFKLAIQEIIAMRKELEKLNKKTDFIFEELHNKNEN